MRQRPHFIIIGGMKCATSTLNRQLNHQPGILIPRTSEGLHEINYFSNDEQFSRGAGWYHSLFSAAQPGDLLGEDSTHYTKLPTYPKTVARMHAHIPDAKLIYLMRHPIKRLISHYKHLWSERGVQGPIDEAWKKHYELIDYSCYARQIAPYLEQYGPDRILPVFFEHFVRQPQAELERICQFIGYQEQPVWHSDEANQNVSAERMRTSPVRDLIVWNPVVTWLRRKFVTQSLRDKIKRHWQIKEAVQLNAQSIEQMEQIFDEDLAQLGALLDLNLNCQSFESIAKESCPQWQKN